MSLKGTGVDIVEIRRIERLINRYGDIFLNRVFTESEHALAQARSGKGTFFAGRWAAKEAFYKALPRCCQKKSSWKSIEVLRNEGSKRPCINICSEELSESLKKENIKEYHISISHEKKYCIANVVLE